MIYPTRRAVVLAAAGAPPALAAGLVAPGWWAAAGGWLALVLGLVLADAFLGPSVVDAELTLEAPADIGIGGIGEARVAVAFARARPPGLSVAVETNARLIAEPDRLPLTGGHGTFKLTPVRRGLGEISALWLRWTGPLGLVWKQRRDRLARQLPVTPNIAAVRAQAVRLFSRQALAGLKTQLEVGDGSDLHALKELVGPSDARAIDWKQSAKHLKLLGKEFRAESNHPIIFAIDAGRPMCEPLGGAPRLDLALNATLLAAFVSLKLGDRVAIFGFDARPRLYTGLMSGASAFEHLRRLSAGLDYSSDETNFTLGLSELAARLQRRSLVVVFTEFADATSAELMIENVGRLVRRHLVLFVVFRDEELESISAREPRSTEDITRSVTAASLLRDRGVVIERLRRLGAHILDAPSAEVGPALISAYLDLKRRELL